MRKRNFVSMTHRVFRNKKKERRLDDTTAWKQSLLHIVLTLGCCGDEKRVLHGGKVSEKRVCVAE